MTKDEINQMDSEYAKIFHEETEKVRLLKLEWKNKLKGLVNINSLFKWLDDHDYWLPIDIVEIYNIDEKQSGYSSYQHVRIKDDKDKLLYMMQNEDEIRGVTHYCVWQTCGMMGDDYSGYLLFPLKNGKYFKVSYAC